MTYKLLSQDERYQIYALMKAGHNQLEIAQLMDRHRSTISRELARNSEKRGYRPKQALCLQRAKGSRNAYRIPDESLRIAAHFIRDQRSSVQDTAKVNVSHKTLYRFIYKYKDQGGGLGDTCAAKKETKALRWGP